MITFPTEPGLYFHIWVAATATNVGSRVYLLKVLENGRFWHPVSLNQEDIRGSFVRIPDEIREQAFAEAREVFVDEKAKDILRLSGYDQKRYLEEVDLELRGLVKARIKELDPSWKD